MCCNLSGDLVDRMIELANRRSPKFDYMIVEASGVSEPAAVAALFGACDEDHDHADHEAEVSLSDVARLDTLVTVVDSAQFMRNAGQKGAEGSALAPRLLTDQVEYSNVILLNKTDLVSAEQLERVCEHVEALNGKAKIIPCRESHVDVSEVVNTGLYKADDFDLENFSEMFARQNDKPKSCCKASIARGESPCCLRARTIDSGLSKVLLPSKKTTKTRHNENYEITSFVYKARRPWNPEKFNGDFIEPYFVVIEDEDDEEEEEEEGKEGEDSRMEDTGDATEKAPETKVDEEKESEELLEKLQAEGTRKAALVAESFGTLLRMKGFTWAANAHDLVGFVSAAGNVARFDSPGPWNCLDGKAYAGTEPEKARLRRDWDGEWGDRRQELVFIGRDLKHEEIQRVLDSCLLSDEEMAMGLDGWKASFGDIFLHGE